MNYKTTRTVHGIVMINRNIFLIPLISLLALPFLTIQGSGLDKGKTVSKAEQPSFVVPSPLPTEGRIDSMMPPVRHEESPVTSKLLDFDTESEEHPLGRGTPGVALLLGGAFQHTGTGWDSAPTVAARYYFAKRDSETSGPEALSPWSIELGALLPHQVSGSNGGSVLTYIGNTGYLVKIHKYTQEHLAFQYRWPIHRPIRVTPEISLGFALAQFENDFSQDFNQGTSHTNSLGPLARAGLSLLANDWVALRLEAGYIHFSNKVNDFGQSFDMGLSGFGFYPSLQISLGYLQPGVEKGVYLPPSALPLWVLSALQTEKRSPIIAPPEVALNAHQAAQGGLSGNVLFQYKNRSAQKVELLGDFNHWQPEAMYLDQAHVWVTVKDLHAGPYHYVFLVNGKREIRDPWNTSFDLSKRAHGASAFVVPEVMPSR